LFRSSNKSSSSGSGGGTAGFTLIEVLVALTVVAISLSAIGSLVAVTIRGARSVGGHLALVESARGIMTGLPGRDELTFGNISGEVGGHRWRVDVLPFYADFVDAEKSNWIPQTVVVRVQSPSGPILQLNTVRLRRKQAP
jgi:general secretion pathway protein I